MGAGIPPAYPSFYLDIPVAKDTFHQMRSSIFLRIVNSTLYCRKNPEKMSGHLPIKNLMKRRYEPIDVYRWLIPKKEKTHSHDAISSNDILPKGAPEHDFSACCHGTCHDLSYSSAIKITKANSIQGKLGDRGIFTPAKILRQTSAKRRDARISQGRISRS